jgi:predicted AlkP superfamily phosphohydrolase/phosphomutase
VTGAAVGGAALMWTNLTALHAAIDETTARRMAAGAGAMSACALMLGTIAAVHGSFETRGRRVVAGLFVAATMLALLAPIAMRGVAVSPLLPARPVAQSITDASPAGSPRLVLIALDGASLDYITPAAAAGRLPNFGKALDSGVSVHLATVRPTQPQTVWTAAATSKLPPHNGIRSSADYVIRADLDRLQLLPDYCFAHTLVGFGLLSAAPHTSAALRARPLWSILSGSGVSTGVVGWPLTHPAQPVRGFLVDDRFHELRETPSALGDANLTYPAALLVEALAAADGESTAAIEPARADSIDALERLLFAASAERNSPPAESSSVAAMSRDRLYARVAAALQNRYQPQFVAVRYTGLDAVGHEFLRDAEPRRFGRTPPDAGNPYASVIERYYRMVDELVGDAMASLRPDDLLLIVSGFGMEPVSLPRRLLNAALGDAWTSGTHAHSPDGFMIAHGSMTAQGRLPRGHVLDLAPTVLYFFGRSIGRDMDGRARTDLFTPAFSSERPLTFIPSHDR